MTSFGDAVSDTPGIRDIISFRKFVSERFIANCSGDFIGKIVLGGKEPGQQNEIKTIQLETSPSQKKLIIAQKLRSVSQKLHG